MTDFGQRLIDSATEALSIAQGKTHPARVITFDAPDIVAIRKKLGLSQDKFAARFKLPPATIRDWEQGRRHPDTSAINLLKAINYAPETIERALAE